MHNDPYSHLQPSGILGPEPAGVPQDGVYGAGGDLARTAGSLNQIEQIHQASVSFIAAPTGDVGFHAFLDEAGANGVQALIFLSQKQAYEASALSILPELDEEMVSPCKAKVGDLAYSGLGSGNCRVFTTYVGNIKTLANLRAAAESLAKNLSQRGLERVVVVLEDFGMDCGMRAALWEMTYGLQMGVYFPSMKSASADSTFVQSVTFALPDTAENHKEFAETAKDADRILQQASNTALGSQFMRQLVQMPPNVMGTRALYRAAKAIQEKCPAVKVSCEKIDRNSRLRMMHAVGRVSSQPSYVITLRYEGDPEADLQALVGKGLVYDTGGINLKSNGGAGMKADMGGGAMVLGAMLGAALNEAPVNLVAVVGAVCNDIGPDAYRPDDVLTAYNGKTVEIINTDAEGRLVLADCLSYVEDEYSPTRIFSFATLTGAASVFSGLRAPFFTDNEVFAKKLLSDAERAEEMIIHIPMDDYLKPTVESGIADLRNTSSGRECGHTTAAIFLNHFVEKTPYCHIDIAGACDINPDRGGGAFGIPMMMAYFDVPIM